MPIKKSAVAAAIAALSLALTATPAMAVTPIYEKPTPIGTADMIAAKPVYNKAGVKEMLKAASSLKSALRAGTAAAKIAEQLEAGIEAGTLSETAEARLVARYEVAMNKAQVAYREGMALADAANTLHDLRAEEIYLSGREAEDARSWVAAMMAFERAVDAIEMAQDTGIDLDFS